MQSAEVDGGIGERMHDLFKGFRIMGLRARLLGVVLLAVLPLVALLFAYASYESRVEQQRARADVQARLQSDVRTVQDLVAESRATLLTFGITYAIQTRRWDLAQGNAVRLKAEHPDYALVAVADPEGRIIVSSAGQTGTVDTAAGGFFADAVRTGQLSVSDYQVDPVLRRPTLTVSYPVYDPRGKLICVEYVAFDLKQVRDRLSGGDQGFVDVLVDTAGRVVVRQPPVPGLEGTVPDNELIREVLARRQGSTTTASLDGVTREYFFSPVYRDPQGGLFLAVGYSPDALLADERRTFGLTLFGFAGVALAALFVAWMVGTYSVYRPASVLERAAARMSSGDLTARADIPDRHDEFGALGHEFNAMAEAIESQVNELESARHELRLLNAELEERVRRRTAELEASNKELEAFAYAVSHDLRTPLRAIDGFSQALLEDHADKIDAEGADHLRRVRDAATRMGELIDSLLMLSRLTRREIRIAVVDLTAAAETAAATLRAEEPGRDVTFTAQPDVYGRGDPALLRIVLDNLIGNAWKFTAKHPSAHIEFGTVDVDGEPSYFVRDDGAGFDMAYAGKLFGAFQRVHGQADFPGIGIGLATTARIVRRHGGRIWAEGELEKGATFFFTLS
jgi:signal transduction histidine kinase